MNGFCEMLVESMLNSKIDRLSLIEPNSSKDLYPQLTVKVTNRIFKHKSYLKLRNLFYLLILLKNIPFLRQHRYHFIRLAERKNDKNESFFDSFDRQKKKFSYRGQMWRKQQATVMGFSKEAQLYDILRMKNDMIIQQNLDMIMVTSPNFTGNRMNNGDINSEELFLRSREVIVEEEEGETDESRESLDRNCQVYNLKNTRFL